MPPQMERSNVTDLLEFSLNDFAKEDLKRFFRRANTWEQIFGTRKIVYNEAQLIEIDKQIDGMTSEELMKCYPEPEHCDCCGQEF